ncbi:uncharacterized protein LOC116011955 [Ipomoea triloba]|uniref:uncharacterized protein LOC116011955 n=1 Tax=Ipomoea triloba TaxID=35885 RepID=UPI00125D7944|nr:uncharacterized protein LOC116011955 [Ipomoea triloba]
MLGKQAWRFLSNPYSLVARLYKAKYFPKSSFFEASIGNCPSFCWRSIMAAQDLVCSGARRRIGNGKSTLIWGHPWLPDDNDPMIQTEIPQELNGSTVSGLIDPSTKTWDQEILQDLFDQTDVARIMSIPVSLDYEDSWFWARDPRGCYTVKEGYRCIRGEFTTHPGTFDKWQSMWKSKAPPKWKSLLWRALTDVLPITPNLIIKRVEVDPSCPMCGLEHESLMHTFILCDFSKMVWHESSIPTPSLLGDSFGMWFSNLMNALTAEQLPTAMAVLYFIWHARNKAVWDRCMPTARSTWRMASSALLSWRLVHSPQLQGLTSGTLQAVSFAATTPQPAANHPQLATSHLQSAVDHPSPQLAASHLQLADDHPSPQLAADHHIYFFYAGYLRPSRKATAGAVLYSPGGSFAAAFNTPLQDCFSPLMAESMACKEVLSWIKDRGVHTVVLYTDCASLQQLLASDHRTIYSYVAFPVSASKAIMSTFNSCSVRSVPRSANLAAHSLASLAFNQASALFWDSIPPDFIASLI